MRRPPHHHRASDKAERCSASDAVFVATFDDVFPGVEGSRLSPSDSHKEQSSAHWSREDREHSPHGVWCYASRRRGEELGRKAEGDHIGSEVRLGKGGVALVVQPQVEPEVFVPASGSGQWQKTESNLGSTIDGGADDHTFPTLRGEGVPTLLRPSQAPTKSAV